MFRTITFASVLALCSAMPAQAKGTKPAATSHCAECAAILRNVVADPLRKADQPRDVYRHPVETLSFFGIRPDMKVGEYAPGGEWYSRLLGLYLGARGRLVGLYFDPASPAYSDETKARIRQSAADYAHDVAKFTGFPAQSFAGYTLDTIPAAEKGTFDRILVSRMLHNMMRWNNADTEIKALRALLKPGGMLGIEQHRARADASYAYADGSKGYLRQADVVKFMEVNGFTFIGSSEVNANKQDPANWPDGVWTLPPTLRLGEKDKAKYQAIGESDRMTLLFRKRD